MHNMYIMYLLGFKKLGSRDLRGLFSTNPMDRDPLLCELTTRLKLEKFLREVHFEDSADPRGKKFPHSTNYRPNGVPKVGLLLEKFRQRCLLFCPEENLSFDEATAKYGGRMTRMKHLQSKYKPYDGIRIYSLNGSKSGYTCNFKVDLRDGTSVEDMAQVTLTLSPTSLSLSLSLTTGGVHPFQDAWVPSLGGQRFCQRQPAQVVQGQRHQLRRHFANDLRFPEGARRRKSRQGDREVDVAHGRTRATRRVLV
jgi:hypothetical protein